MSTVSGRSKKSILDPGTDGDVIGPRGLLDIVVKKHSDIANIFPTDKLLQLKWLARFGLVANHMNCPTAACGPNQAMLLVEDKQRQDQYVVS